jgi:hypothetical protein
MTLAVVAAPLPTRGQNTNAPLGPETSVSSLIERQIIESRAEITNAETSLKSALDEFQGATNNPAAQQRLETARDRLNASKEKLITWEQLLQEQGPMRPLLRGLKTKRDAIPSLGTDEERRLRAEYDRRIAAVEQAELALTKPINSPMGRPASEIRMGKTAAGILVGVVVLALVAAVVFVCCCRRKGASDESQSREALAHAVVTGGIGLIVVVAVGSLFCAGLNAVFWPDDPTKTTTFFDMAKWVLSSVLPVVGAWVGGVLAFYFGKDNFKAGAENVQNLIKQLSPQQKLEARKADDSGIAMTSAHAFGLGVSAKLEDVDLRQVDFKAYERLPFVDSAGAVRACLHRSTYDKYCKDLTDAEKVGPAKMVMRELCKKLNWNPEASFATVSGSDSLATVQGLMKANKECRDVFVTADGTKPTAAKRWITDDDLLKVANG